MMFKRIMDWWRGYDDTDVNSLNAKFQSDEGKRIDGIIELTCGEYRALLKVKDGRIVRP